MQKLLQVIVVSICLLVSSCVTKTISPYDDKKDLAKAERSYIQLGYGYFERDNFLEAKKSLTTALEINSRSAGAHIGLARVYDRELEYELANDHFRKAIRYGGGSEAHFQYGVYLYNRHEYQGAYREFKTVLKDTIYERRPQAFEYQAIVSSRLGKTDESISYYRRAIALTNDLPNAHLGLTRIYFNRGENDVAYKYYGGFIRLVREQQVRHTAATLWLGIQLAHLNNDANLEASLELQLKNQFKKTPQYKQYEKWKAEQSPS
ncbi:MAG: tetratricopeptide repeat protein [Reinekea sp.]|jgi:type IV pilus assembly protein PilF